MFPRRGMSFETWRWDTLTALPWRVYSLVSWQSSRAINKAGLRDVRSLQMKRFLTHQGWLCYGTNHTVTFEKVGSCSWSRKVTLGRGNRTCKAKGTKGARKPEGCASDRMLGSCEMRPGWNWTSTSPTSVGSERKAGVYPEGGQEQGKGFPQYYGTVTSQF